MMTGKKKTAWAQKQEWRRPVASQMILSRYEIGCPLRKGLEVLLNLKLIPMMSY
jgi:hypothetical protein